MARLNHETILMPRKEGYAPERAIPTSTSMEDVGEYG